MAHYKFELVLRHHQPGDWPPDFESIEIGLNSDFPPVIAIAAGKVQIRSSNRQDARSGDLQRGVVAEYPVDKVAWISPGKMGDPASAYNTNNSPENSYVISPYRKVKEDA